MEYKNNQFVTNGNNTVTWIALTQQEYLSNIKNNNIINKPLSELKLFAGYYSLKDKTTCNIKIFGKKNRKLQVIYQGKIENIPHKYLNLKILPWNEEIETNLQPLTLYIYVSYNQNEVDKVSDQIDKAYNYEDEEEDKYFRLFNKKSRKTFCYN